MELVSSSCHYIWLFLCLFFPLVHSFNEGLGESLDVLLHDHDLKTLFPGRPRTGSMYNATLPVNLAGMKVSAIRMRSKTLWRVGVNLTNIFIPPRTLLVPHTRRLFIAYHDLGNWSSIYCNVSGYTLITSVIGFVLYDASNLSTKSLTKLDLNPTEKPVLIHFDRSASPSDTNLRAKCATFGAYGEISMGDMSTPNVCQARSQGYFSLVIPSLKQQKVRRFWVIGFVLASVCLALMALIATVFLRALTMKKARDMDREADEGEVLNTFWVDSSKMPRATVTRTHPVLEYSGRP